MMNAKAHLPQALLTHPDPRMLAARILPSKLEPLSREVGQSKKKNLDASYSSLHSSPCPQMPIL